MIYCLSFCLSIYLFPYLSITALLWTAWALSDKKLIKMIKMTGFLFTVSSGALQKGKKSGPASFQSFTFRQNSSKFCQNCKIYDRDIKSRDAPRGRVANTLF